MDCSEFSFVLEEAREPEKKMTKLIFKINRFEIKLRTVEFIHFAFGLFVETKLGSDYLEQIDR